MIVAKKNFIKYTTFNFFLFNYINKPKTKKINKISVIKMIKELWIIASEDSIKFLASEVPEINYSFLFLIFVTINYFYKKLINLNIKILIN